VSGKPLWDGQHEPQEVVVYCRTNQSSDNSHGRTMVYVLLFTSLDAAGSLTMRQLRSALNCCRLPCECDPSDSSDPLLASSHCQGILRQLRHVMAVCVCSITAAARDDCIRARCLLCRGNRIVRCERHCGGLSLALMYTWFAHVLRSETAVFPET
jgi:hypothetical protein